MMSVNLAGVLLASNIVPDSFENSSGQKVYQNYHSEKNVPTSRSCSISFSFLFCNI